MPFTERDILSRIPMLDRYSPSKAALGGQSACALAYGPQWQGRHTQRWAAQNHLDDSPALMEFLQLTQEEGAEGWPLRDLPARGVRSPEPCLCRPGDLRRLLSQHTFFEPHTEAHH